MNSLTAFKNIKTFVFDMDGVLTDGTLLISKDHEWLRRMHIRDGYALQLAVKKGYRIVVLSGSVSLPVKKRLHLLGIRDVYMMVTDKKVKLEKYIKKHGLSPQEILYMGDDIPDLDSMQTVGLPCCPSDAATELKAVSKYISPLKGGEGCVRDVLEKVLNLNGDWETH
jgi:3-deoxy-D-manno-octulosonate 8-phosphate phosphatase (KDO 8-P phosphatase)